MVDNNKQQMLQLLIIIIKNVYYTISIVRKDFNIFLKVFKNLVTKFCTKPLQIIEIKQMGNICCTFIKH